MVTLYKRFTHGVIRLPLFLKVSLPPQVLEHTDLPMGHPQTQEVQLVEQLIRSLVRATYIESKEDKTRKERIRSTFLIKVIEIQEEQ